MLSRGGPEAAAMLPHGVMAFLVVYVDAMDSE